MNREEQALLILSAQVLSYPTDGWRTSIREWDETLDDVFSKKLAKKVKQVYESLLQLDLCTQQELYVETFDLKSSLGLYLTAYELGDSNRRGAALIKLQKVINESGFERDEAELSDYIPMLLEFLAVAPNNQEVKRLKKRMGVAIGYMMEKISRENPYASILNILTTYIFPVPTKEEMKQLELGREKADLEELPYPIMYQ